MQLTMRIGVADHATLLRGEGTRLPIPLLLVDRGTVINHLLASDQAGRPLSVIESAVTEEILAISLDLLRHKAVAYGATSFSDAMAQFYRDNQPILVDLPTPDSPLFNVNYSRKRLNSQGSRRDLPDGRSGERWKQYQVPLSLSARSQSYHLRIEETEDRFLSELYVVGTERTRCAGLGPKTWEVCLPERTDRIAECQRSCQPECYGGPHTLRTRRACVTPDDRHIAHATQFGAAFAHLYIPAPAAKGGVAVMTRDGPLPWNTSAVPASAMNGDELQAVVYFDEVPPGSALGIAMIGWAIGLISVIHSVASAFFHRPTWTGFPPLIVALLPLLLGVFGLSTDRLRLQCRNNSRSLSALVLLTLAVAVCAALFPAADLGWRWLNLSLIFSVGCLSVGVIASCRVWGNVRRYRAAADYQSDQVSR